METVHHENSMRRISIVLISLALLVYLIGVVRYFTGDVNLLTIYLLIGAHIVLIIGLFLFIGNIMRGGTAGTKFLLILLFLFLLAVPVYFYWLNGSYSNLSTVSNTIVYYDKGRPNEITLKSPSNENPQAATGIKRKVKSYKMMATVNSNGHIIVGFDEGEPELIPVNNLAELASYEAVLRQPSVVMYIQGVTKTLQPDNITLKSY